MSRYADMMNSFFSKNGRYNIENYAIYMKVYEHLFLLKTLTLQIRRELDIDNGGRVPLSLSEFSDMLTSYNSYIVSKGIHTPYILAHIYNDIYGTDQLLSNLSPCQRQVIKDEIILYLNMNPKNNMYHQLMPLYNIM